VNRTAGTLLAVLLLVAAGCGSAASPAGSSGGGSAAPSVAPSGAGGGGGAKPNPCTLLSQDELKAQVGVPFGPGNLVGSTSAPHVECEWAKEGAVTATISLSIDDTTPAGWGCLSGQPVPGLGDAACFDGGNGLLHVRHGGWDLVFLRAEGVTQDQILNVAKAALSHL